MSDRNEETEVVDVAGLQKSLDELLKAADATAISKAGGVNVSHSGRVDEDGHGGGGLESSTGGLDNMMIGKMRDAGVPADIIDSFVGYMKGKAEDEDEESESGEGEEEEDYGKSMDHFRADPALSDAFDVSTALESFVERNAELHDTLGKSIRQYQGRQESVNGAMAKALHAVGTTLAEQNGVIEELGRRLGVVERQPASVRKGVTTAASAALQKGMPGEAGDAPLELRKSELTSTLSYMNLEKGIKHVAGQPTGQLASLIEAGAPVTEEIFTEVESFLKSNPNEAGKARQYA